MLHVVRLGDDTETVTCADDQTVLDAFLRAGRWLPNSCNQGTCGTCRVQVLDGRVDQTTAPVTTLSFADREDGWMLACQARPLTDLVVASPAGAGARRTAPLRDLTARIVSMEDVALDTRRVRLEPSSGLDFEPGQHLAVVVPGTEDVRHYSMANDPAEYGHLELHVRRQPGGQASAWLFGTAAVGDEVAVTGPIGDFWWQGGEEPVIMLAGGTGLAPMMSMIRHGLRRRPDAVVTLFHGVRTDEHLYDVDLLDQLAHDHEGFTWIPCVDDRGTGLIDTFLSTVTSARGLRGYLCGPPPMVEAGASAFRRRRMSPRLIHREQFLPAADPVADVTSPTGLEPARVATPTRASPTRSERS